MISSAIQLLGFPVSPKEGPSSSYKLHLQRQEMGTSTELMCSQWLYCPSPATGAELSLLWYQWNSSAKLQPCPLSKPISYSTSDVWPLGMVWMVRSRFAFISQVWMPASKLLSQKGREKKPPYKLCQTHLVSGIQSTTLWESILFSSPWCFWNQSMQMSIHTANCIWLYLT